MGWGYSFNKGSERSSLEAFGGGVWIATQPVNAFKKAFAELGAHVPHK